MSPQIEENIKTAVDKGWFTVKVEINDGQGGTIKTQAEVEISNIKPELFET